MAELRRCGPLPQQDIDVFYQARITGGRLRPQPDGDLAESVCTAIADVESLRRSLLVDVDIPLAHKAPKTSHVAPVPVGGLIQG